VAKLSVQKESEDLILKYVKNHPGNHHHELGLILLEKKYSHLLWPEEAVLAIERQCWVPW